MFMVFPGNCFEWMTEKWYTIFYINKAMTKKEMLLVSGPIPLCTAIFCYKHTELVPQRAIWKRRLSIYTQISWVYFCSMLHIKIIYVCMHSEIAALYLVAFIILPMTQSFLRFFSRILIWKLQLKLKTKRGGGVSAEKKNQGEFDVVLSPINKIIQITKWKHCLFIQKCQKIMHKVKPSGKLGWCHRIY